MSPLCHPLLLTHARDGIHLSGSFWAPLQPRLSTIRPSPRAGTSDRRPPTAASHAQHTGDFKSGNHSRWRGEHCELCGRKDSDINASCRIPFEALKDPKTGTSFALSALLNENAKLAENLRQRYLVADLNSTDENGNCRGVQEYFTPVGELSEFPRLRAIAEARKTDVASLATETVEALVASEERPGDSAGLALELEDLQNYLRQVQRYKTDPVVKPSVVHGYCVG